MIYFVDLWKGNCLGNIFHVDEHHLRRVYRSVSFWCNRRSLRKKASIHCDDGMFFHFYHYFLYLSSFLSNMVLFCFVLFEYFIIVINYCHNYKLFFHKYFFLLFWNFSLRDVQRLSFLCLFICLFPVSCFSFFRWYSLSFLVLAGTSVDVLTFLCVFWDSSSALASAGRSRWARRSPPSTRGRRREERTWLSSTL